MPRYPDDDDDWLFESAIEAAKRLGQISYIDESVRNLAPREYLSITDVELPEPGIKPANPTLHEGGPESDEPHTPV